MFAYRHRVGRVELAFTNRHGGVSAAPFESLNLGSGGGDDPRHVSQNLARTAEHLGVSAEHLVTMRQTHSCDVAVVPGDSGEMPTADAMVTTSADAVLCVRAADCVPVLFADDAAGVVGCAHAGRTGLAAGVVPSTVRRLRELGADDVVAVVGPHICGDCYEVPTQLREQVSAVVPESGVTTRWGTPGLDIGAGVRAQLRQAGCTVVDVSRCTLESPDLFSYRRDGPRSGRQAGLVRLAGE